MGENAIPDLDSLKPFEFEPKVNIGDINSSSSHDEEEGAEYKVKPISNSEWGECSAKQSLADVLQNRCQTLLKRHSNTGFFLKNLRNL